MTGRSHSPVFVFFVFFGGPAPQKPAQKHPCERRRREVGREWERPGVNDHQD